MKKVLVFLFCISIILIISCNKHEKIIIPKEAIRYRIIANSNSFEDQEQKMFVNTLIEPVIADVLDKSNTINESRENILNNISKMENILDKQNINYSLKYGYNYFPVKEYCNIKYDAGNYESLVITLGSGLGDNWWCVMFPPLCLIEAKENEIDDIKYSFYIKDIIDKYI